MVERVFDVLFLCTGNSARSILAEAMLRQDGAGRFRAHSGGSHPRGIVNPFALKVLEAYGYGTGGLRSKSWHEFAIPGAPRMDFVFDVGADRGADAPDWPGLPMTACWGIEDPTAADGSDIEREAAFVAAVRQLRNRISVFVNLPFASIDRMALGVRLDEIGRTHLPLEQRLAS